MRQFDVQAEQDIASHVVGLSADAGLLEPRQRDAFVVAEEGERERALAIVTSLRRAGLSADLDLAGRSRKGQMKQADRRGARYTVLLDAEEPTLLRDMATGDQRSVDDEALAEELQPPTT